MYRLNVYDATQKRLKIIFDYFDYVYVSFSGGKDSGVLLNLCIEYIRKYAPGRKLGVFHIDYEIQYQQTTEYVKRTLSKNQDILEVFHCCVPFKVTTCTSMFQRYWRPWESSHQELWARDMPQNCLTQDDFEFYTEELWDYDFQKLFIKWLRKKTKSRHICCLVGIRTQESFNRWRSIHSDKNYKRLLNYKWTHKTGWHEYNAYPIFDWNTSDIWVANGYFNWDYNHLYDLYYQAPTGSKSFYIRGHFHIGNLQNHRPLYLGKNDWKGKWGWLCRFVWEFFSYGMAQNNLSIWFFMEALHGIFTRDTP